MGAINYGTGFTNSAFGWGLDIPGRNQSSVIVYVDYAVMGTETGVILTFKTRNPDISLVDCYNLEERDPLTEIVDVVNVKVRSTGLRTIPVPIPLRSDFCVIDVTWDGLPDGSSVINLAVDLDTLKYV